ncbi:MAG: CoA-transferase [Anaerotruncus massiliensis (ex Togo et al. 2019)]
MIGGAQVDRYGNVNSMILDRETGGLKTMLPGSGRAFDIATSAKRTIIIMRSTRRCFVEKVDYITAGLPDGPGCRKNTGCPAAGRDRHLRRGPSVSGGDEGDVPRRYHPGVSVRRSGRWCPGT